MVGQRTNAIEKVSLLQAWSSWFFCTPKSSRGGFFLKFKMLSIVKHISVQLHEYCTDFLLEIEKKRTQTQNYFTVCFYY